MRLLCVVSIGVTWMLGLATYASAAVCPIPPDLKGFGVQYLLSPFQGGTIQSTPGVVSQSGEASNANSEAFYSADLTTGILKALAVSPPILSNASSVVAYTQIFDTLCFNQDTTIPFTATVDGFVNVSSLDPSIGNDSGVLVIVSEQDPVTGNGIAQFLGEASGAGQQSVTVAGALTFQANVPVQFGFAIDVNALFGDVADFSHTGRFSWDVPVGVSYTSASGQFLANAQPVQVPEPATVVLCISALGAMGLVRRIRARERSPEKQRGAGGRLSVNH